MKGHHVAVNRRTVFVFISSTLYAPCLIDLFRINVDALEGIVGAWRILLRQSNMDTRCACRPRCRFLPTPFANQSHLGLRNHDIMP